MSAWRWKRPGSPYIDVRARTRHGVDDADEEEGATPPFAPPFLKAGKLVIGQTANILFYLGARHGLAPKAEAAGFGCISFSSR